MVRKLKSRNCIQNLSSSSVIHAQAQRICIIFFLKTLGAYRRVVLLRSRLVASAGIRGEGFAVQFWLGRRKRVEEAGS
eukprot:1186231-Prorocentrum_minimum.AAC.3